MEAVAEAVTPEQAVKAALLAAYDGVLRVKAGRLLTEPDPRGGQDAIAELLAELAVKDGMVVPEMLGEVLAAALRAALTEALEGHTEARQALELLLG
jgi:hypothetical protein